MQETKKRFYLLMIRYYTHNQDYLEIAKSYLAIYDTPSIKTDETSLKTYLAHGVIYACLAPYDNAQSDLINRLSLDANLKKIPLYEALITAFLTKEIMHWSQVQSSYQAELSTFKEFQEATQGESDLWNVFRSRVVQHVSSS